MAIAAGLIGMLSTIIGLRAAYVLDTPAGPSIVCAAAITFLATSVLKGFRHPEVRKPLDNSRGSVQLEIEA